MGIWAEIDGVCSGCRKQKVSIKKLLADFFVGEDWSLEYTIDDDNDSLRVNIRYEESGRRAFETFDSLCAVLSDVGITFDLSVTIRNKS